MKTIDERQRRHRRILALKRLYRAVVPAILLALSVGQVYAFTLFSSPIAEHIGCGQGRVQFAFSLSIFFLGAGAATFGKIVERNIRVSTAVGTVLFILGMLTAAAGVHLKQLWLVLLGYGGMVGLGTGIIYISPVKTLMLWFARHKAIAAAIPIVSFGLGSSLCTLLFSVLRSHFTIAGVLGCLAAIYVLPMTAGAMLLRKPPTETPERGTAGAGDGFTYGRLLKDTWFLRAWAFMFLNIGCGLCIIPLAKQLMASAGYGAGVSTLVISACGLMNGAGRLAFAWWSDRLANRLNILLIILSISAGAMAASFAPVCLGLAIMAVNACYGAGFSTIPAVLADHYGMENISKIHGAVLSAWGVAGLVGNQLALAVFERWGMNVLFGLLIGLYALNLANAKSMIPRSGLRG